MGIPIRMLRAMATTASSTVAGKRCWRSSQTVWRVRRPPFSATCVDKPGICAQLFSVAGAVDPLSVDTGHVVAREANGTLTVRTSGRMGPPRATDYSITVPRWMAVKLSGVYTDMTVEGTENDVRATTVKGDVELKDSDGNSYPVEKRMALCRCGASTEKPFCDGTHSKIGFQAAERAVPESAEN